MEERERKIDDKQCIERGRDEVIADKDRVGSRIDDKDETESKLDVSSDQFDPLLALYSPKITLPFPNIKCFNNIAEYESFLKGGRGRAKPENVEKKLRQAQKGVPDPCRIERLKKLIVNAPPDEGEGSCGKRPPRKQKGRKNVLTRMPLHAGSPLGELHRCVQERIRVKVHIRTFKGLRGVCAGFVVAFDKFWNMAMVDVDETYRKPLLGEAFYHERALTVTRLFDRLKLQESPEFRLAEQKEPNPEGRGGFKSLPTEAREQNPTSLLRRSPRKRTEAGAGSVSGNQGSQRGSGELRTTGAGHSSRTEGEHKEMPPSRVDYQRVHTRHINQLFIRGENVLLINLQP